MTIIQRYLAKNTIAYILLVMFVVLCLSFFINLLGEFKDIGVGDYGFSASLMHTLLRLPADVYQFFPMIALLGVILGLGVLTSQHELIVMRTAGMAYHQILLGVLAGACLLLMAATVFGEWVSPPANFLADKLKESAKNKGQAVATLSGIWIHEGNDFLHVDQVMGTKHLEGVTRYQFDAKHKLLAAHFVQSMDYANHRWFLKNRVTTHFAPDQVIVDQKANDVWSLGLNPQLLNVGMISPDEMSLDRLYRYMQHLKKNGLQSIEFRFFFWKRIFQPLATLAMVLLAVPFVMTFSRSAMLGRRMLLGVVIGFIFYILNALIGQLSIVYQLVPWMAALVPTLLFGGMGYWLGRRF